MSIASEITRLQNAKSSLKTAINSKLSSSLITNETIDDYAAKVASIVVPSGEIIQGDLKASVGVGKNLDKEDNIYVGTNINKLNGEYCIDISATEIKLIKYEDNTIQVIDTLQETNSGSLINIYEDNDDFYVIYSETGKIKVIYTDLKNIKVFTSNVIGNLLQTDTNKFVSYVKVSNANRIDAQAITIDYNGSSTSITVGETQQMISTSNSYSGAGAYVVGENRIVFYMCDYKTSEEKCNTQFVLKKVNNNQLEAITSNTLVYTYNPYGSLGTPSFSIKQSSPGELEITMSDLVMTSTYGYATITDSGITFTEDSTYSRTNYIYDLSLKQILSNGNLYSLSGYTYTLIENISGKPGNSSPRDYAMSKLKTNDNKILMPSGSILRIYSNTISSENLIKYYNPSLIGPYISAESGEAGDTIKMYSPSI